MTETALTKNQPENRAWASAPVDVWEGDAEYVLALDVPGVKKDDVTLTLENGRLLVSAERHSNGTALDIRRAFKLQGELATDAMKAELRDGVLTVRVPKAEERKPRQIPITVS